MMIEREMWVVSHTGFRHGPFPRSEAVDFLNENRHSHMRAVFALERPRPEDVVHVTIDPMPRGLFDGPPPGPSPALARAISMAR